MTKRILRILGVALAYYLAARLGLRLSLVGHNVTPIWPPTGIAVAAFLIFGYRVWPGVALAAFVVNAPITPSLGSTLLITAGNTAAPLASIFIMRRFGGAANLRRAKEVLVFVFGGALLAMTISAGVGSSALRLAGVISEAQHLSTFLVWWTGDSMGVLVFAPALLLLRESHWPKGAKTWRAVEGLLLCLLFVLTTDAVLSSTGHYLFLIFPLIIWAAVRFQRTGAVVAVAFVSLMAARAAAMLVGPFEGLVLSRLMLTLNALNGSLALTGYLLAAVTIERLQAQE
ncbi:MAG TPA: MASE1 domain-containing protein, partial [Actinomycetota bacterium]|nr:MASE1 domain-containing protein [Actinomycetota bacterium]